MSFIDYLDLWNFLTAAKFLFSTGVGAVCLSMAIFLKQRNLKGPWYTSLRYILAALSISALSNAYSILLLGQVNVQPTELFMNVCILILLGWSWGFYRYKLFKCDPNQSLEKVLKFVQSEISREKTASKNEAL